MCAKDDLVGRKGPLSTSTQTWEVLFQTHDRRLAEELATAESVTAKDPNHVDTFSSDFAFSFAAWLQQIKYTLGDVNSLFADEDIAKTSGLSRLKADQHFFVYQNILSLIAFIISYRPFADELLVYVTIENLSREARRRRSTPSTLLAEFIPTTKICDPLLKSQVYHYCIGKLLSPLENAAKSGILLACADGRTRQYYLTICAILANYEEQVLLTSVKKNRHCTRCTKHYNFNIHVSLATDTLHLLLKGLVIKMLDFMQDILDDIYPGSRKTWDNSTTLVTQESAVVSLLFVSKAPFALHFIHAVCNLVTLAQYKSHDEDTLAYIQGALERMNVFKEEFQVYQRTLGEEKNFNYPKWHALTHIIQDIRMYRALNSICTRANSEAHHITIVKQFYSITNKKEYILQICLHNSQRTALLAADYATMVKQSQPSTTVDIQDRTYSTRVTRPLPFCRLRWSIPGIQPHSTKLLLSEVAANIAISNFTHAAAVFQSSGKRHNDPKHCDEEVLHLILIIIDYTRYDKDRKHIAYIGAFSEILLFNNNRQIDNTTGMLSFYDLSTIIRPVHLVPRDLPNLTTHEYNRLYSPTFNIDLLRTLREYRRKRTRNN
ncbi:hypothetical protein HBI78_243400 [Parastagonospora nodorum]|nr:hypothetical protein HBI78_243400 [Parastagonospora nodorum]